MSALEAITLKQLRALRVVAELGTISAAAEALSLTPSAVHSQRKTLYNLLGVELLTRQGGGDFSPTPEGRVILEAHAKTEAAMTRAIAEIDALRRGVAGRVVLGVVSTGKYFAPSIVARLKKLYPDIEIRLEIGNRTEIIEGLETNRIDIAIMGRPPRRPEVTAHAIGTHPHVMIASPENALARHREVSHADILAQDIILREEGSGTRILAIRYLDRIGEGAAYESIEMGSNETIKQAVIANLGIALISLHTVIEELAAGRLVMLNAAGLPILRQWFILHPSDLIPTGAMTTIIGAIRNDAAAMIRADEVARLLETAAPLPPGP
jgi:DNA-binding transcriptional LysR family regulator